MVGLNKEGSVVADRKFPTGEVPLINVIKSVSGDVHVHLEASELAGWIRRTLKTRVARVIVSHPRSNAWIAKDPLKRDRLDAFKLADLLRMNRVHEVHFAEDDRRAEFKQIVQHYDDVTDQEVRLKLKIKARLRTQGVIAKSQDVYSPKGRVAYMARVPSAIARKAIGQLYGLLDHTLKAQDDAFDLMCHEGKRYPEIERFDEVPGVGPVGACRFSAYVQTPHRFSSKRKLWRYCRLGITDRRSDGKPLGRQRLDSSGNGRLKAMSRVAFHGAIRARSDNLFKRAFRRSEERTHNPTHARLTIQRKILAVLLAMWKGGTRYQDDKG
jgi:transposase